MTDAQAALAQVREALAARPTPGQWFAVNDGNRTEPFMNVKAERISGRGPTHEVAICATGDSPQSMETANARYIAACSPVNMTAILAHIDAQAAEIERLTSSGVGYSQQTVDALSSERDRLRAALTAAMEVVQRERTRIAYNAKGAPPAVEVGYADILHRIDAVIVQADAALGSER